VQVATAVTRYWIGARDNRGGIYVSQVNRNLICGTPDLVPEGVEVAQFLSLPGGKAGETKEDLLCEKVYPTHPLCLGTYTSMCVSTGQHEGEHWAMNTEADEACVRSFEWRAASDETRTAFQAQLQRYIMAMAVDLDTCALKAHPRHQGRMLLECGGATTQVFSDTLMRR
jgi:hypothetical protein